MGRFEPPAIGLAERRSFFIQLLRRLELKGAQLAERVLFVVGRDCRQARQYLQHLRRTSGRKLLELLARVLVLSLSRQRDDPEPQGGSPQLIGRRRPHSGNRRL